jgi:hypothetical protein
VVIKSPKNINLKIRKRKFRCIGQTLRKDGGELPKAALQCEPQKSRKRGRKKLVEKIGYQTSGEKLDELRFQAAGTQEWKEVVETYVPKRNNGLYYYYYHHHQHYRYVCGHGAFYL